MCELYCHLLIFYEASVKLPFSKLDNEPYYSFRLYKALIECP